MKTIYVKLEIEEGQFEEEGMTLQEHFGELSTCINLLETVELENGETMEIKNNDGTVEKF